MAAAPFLGRAHVPDSGALPWPIRLALLHNHVLLSYLSVVLVSNVWTNDDITAEVAGYKGEIFGNGAKTTATISTIVYPAIDGCNTLSPGYVYGMLSECYLLLENTKDLSPIAPPDHENANIWLCGEASEDLHFDALLAILEEWDRLFTTGKDRETTAEASDGGNDWNNDDWDEGWESHEEVDNPKKENPVRTV
ncbi:secretory pathway protein Sec39 [Sesbania bispinosa]|nr:secretory pathway protein Sec39 [Sesbania bispinosa]